MDCIASVLFTVSDGLTTAMYSGYSYQEQPHRTFSRERQSTGVSPKAARIDKRLNQSASKLQHYKHLSAFMLSVRGSGLAVSSLGTPCPVLRGSTGVSSAWSYEYATARMSFIFGSQLKSTFARHRSLCVSYALQSCVQAYRPLHKFEV